MTDKKSWQEWKTSILGGLTVVISALVLFGVINVDQQSALTENSVGLIEAIGAGVVAISGIINVFRAK